MPDNSVFETPTFILHHRAESIWLLSEDSVDSGRSDDEKLPTLSPFIGEGAKRSLCLSLYVL